jgi:hypothetical protein
VYEHVLERRLHQEVNLGARFSNTVSVAPGFRVREVPGRAPDFPQYFSFSAAMTAATPASAATDLTTIDGILSAMYAMISGAAGEPRDWDRLRTLYLPGARLIPTNRAIHNGQGGHPPDVMDVETFIRTSAPVLEKMDFYEVQIAARVERFGCIAHVWSTYDSRRAPDDPEPFARGINSIQLYHDGARWWVVNVFWDSERADYLPS